VSTETIPELLARLEREHVQCKSGNCTNAKQPHCDCFRDWPCDVARVVAHARSLGLAQQASCEIDDYDMVRAALGEAQ
jgi:hypothetical protein